MPIKYRNDMLKKLIELNIDGIPYVINYKYLGITIDTNGSLDLHLNNLQKRAHYLSRKLTYLKYNMEIKQYL